ncbi:hypothetical protein NE237_008840 [Protea cynaroides]|uniref:Uncharacterized protein n=1 Tax=Protea cynaroides TaxID=273540 RepID=A0A9Q0R056_9MAGN|nr:hypothetical protein NE237_008840 [Protea cynaroides]
MVGGRTMILSETFVDLDLGLVSAEGFLNLQADNRWQPPFHCCCSCSGCHCNRRLRRRRFGTAAAAIISEEEEEPERQQLKLPYGYYATNAAISEENGNFVTLQSELLLGRRD